MESCLAEISGLLDGMAGVLENKIARAATMISNGTDEFRSQLGMARGSLARGRIASPQPPRLPDSEEGILKAVP